jgi:hypothetical protein
LTQVLGSGGVHGKTSYNLLGGYVEFDMNTTRATGETNTNFYTSSPDKCCAYCDIQNNKSPQCMEMDIIENNANCAMATTWHTDPDHNGGCDEGGCAGHSQLPGGVFKMRAEFSTDGTMKTFLDGKEVKVGGSSSVLDKAKGIVVKTMKAKGAMFHSTQVRFTFQSDVSNTIATHRMLLLRFNSGRAGSRQARGVQQRGISRSRYFR